MQGVFYWGMRISRNEVYLLWKQLSLNDYSYLRENYMFEILGYDGYIFGEIIESIYPGEEPVEGPLDIFKVDRADKSRIMSAYVKFNDHARQITVAPIGAEAIFFNISRSYGKRDEYDETKSNILKALNREE